MPEAAVAAVVVQVAARVDLMLEHQEVEEQPYLVWEIMEVVP
jgi:hypothetical protein